MDGVYIHLHHSHDKFSREITIKCLFYNILRRFFVI